MKRSDPDLDTLVAAARQFAAVQDAFAPEAALTAALGPRARSEPILAARVLSALRQDCTVDTLSGAETWEMRPGPRRKTLADGAQATVADTPVADALAGRGAFAPAALDRLITGEAAGAAMESAAVTLDRAGPAAPGFDRLVRLKGLLNRRRAEERTDARLAGGFFGRETELARLADWIAGPQAGPPMRTIHVSGLPGIGKSFLLERVIQMARLSQQPILVTLDFDRAGLNVLDGHGFFEEISRQVGDALPDAAAALRDLRLGSAERRAAETGTSVRYSLPRDLLEMMGRAVGASGHRVLAVVDTLENLRSRGETQVMTLFERFDTLAEFGVTPLVLVSAGRGDALDPVPARVQEHIRLDGLEDSAARRLLQARGVAEALWPRILPLARGNPLLLTLAAKAFEDSGFDAAAIPAGAAAETIGGYLYRAILSRVPDRLRRIANEGLILRSVDADALTEVVAPALGLALTAAEAQATLAELATYHWLVEAGDGGAVRHRQDVRRAFLPLLYAGSAETRAAAEAINLRAAEWYRKRDPVAALYHRLQATRFGHTVPEVPEGIARELAGPVIDELPGPARDALLQAQGRRTGFARAAHDAAGVGEGGRPTAASPDERAVRDLELVLERGDLREAGHVFRAGFAAGYPPDSAAGRIALCHLWLSGRWAVAVDLFRAQPEGALRRALEQSPHLQGRVFLEIGAEAAFARQVRRLADDDIFALACRAHDASQRTGMVGAALDFAFLATGRPAEVLPRRLELARSLLASAGATAREVPEAALALGAAAEARRAFGLFHEPPAAGGPDDRQPGVRAEMLQALNPYGAPLQALVSDVPDGPVAAYLDGLRPRLPEAAARFLPDLRGAEALPGRLRSGPADVVAVLTAMGLGADWCSAHVVGRSRPDLRLLAHAAERWRQTVAGLWSHGPVRPEGWPDDGGEDRMATERLGRLILAPDPVVAAGRQLGFWRSATGRGARRRLAGWASQAHAEGDAGPSGRPVTALRALLEAGAPGVVAAPLAVFMAHGIPPEKAADAAEAGEAG